MIFFRSWFLMNFSSLPLQNWIFVLYSQAYLSNKELKTRMCLHVHIRHFDETVRLEVIEFFCNLIFLQVM